MAKKTIETIVKKRFKWHKAVVDAITSAIIDSLVRNERVTLVGFGTFKVRRRRARTGVNPQTRERLDIPAMNVVRFKAGKGLRERMGKKR